MRTIGHRPRLLIGLVLVVGLSAGCLVGPPPGTVEPPAAAGAVASPEPLASKIGAKVLAEGGNAVDAAVAVHFALAVTFPQAGNLGGGGFLLVHGPLGEVQALDYRETAPRAASAEMFLGPDGRVVEGLSLQSHRAAGVPGSVLGMWELHQRFGSRPWKELLAPAIALARDGFALDAGTATDIGEFLKEIERRPEKFRGQTNFGRYFHRRPGDTLRQPELAATLERIAASGPEDFYRGKTAELLVREMEKGGGLITREDLAGYRVEWRAPLEGRYKGRRIATMPPPSSGGIALLQLLNMLETFDLPERLSPAQAHLFAEMEKRVFADRSVHLGDPAFTEVPIAGLIDKKYAAGRAAEISLHQRTPPGEIREGRPESPDTTHYSVIDARGMAVANTTTLNDSFGSGIVVEGAGFLLNNEMDDFSAKPGVPNLYGVVGGQANRIEPGKRPLSSICPTLVFDRRGRLWLVLGTPGGPTIFTTIFQVIVNRLDYGLPLNEAVDAPRVHHQWPPADRTVDEIVLEKTAADLYPPDLVPGLEKLGYQPAWKTSLGEVQAIEISPGRITGASDRRGNGLTAYP